MSCIVVTPDRTRYVSRSLVYQGLESSYLGRWHAVGSPRKSPRRLASIRIQKLSPHYESFKLVTDSSCSHPFAPASPLWAGFSTSKLTSPLRSGSRDAGT